MTGLLLLCLLFGVAVPLLIILARLSHMADWRTSLVAYQLHPAATLDIAQVENWLAGISAMTHPMRFSLVPLPPICVEVVSTAHGISFYVLVPRGADAKLLAGLRASMPGCRITEAPEYLADRPLWRVAAELTMTNHERPLAVERAEQTATALLASLQPIVGDNTEIRLQYIFTGAGTPRPVPTANATDRNAVAWSWENTVPQDAETVQAARAKRREPLLVATIRAGIAAENQAQAYALFGRIWNNYHGLNNVGVRLRRRLLPSSVIAERLSSRRYPVTHWPLLLGTKEASGLLALPASARSALGVSASVARQLPPPMAMPQQGNVLGVTNYPGMNDRQLALKADDRLRHEFVLGPTGSGKSWLLANQILQDVDSGRGLIVIDPKGDLITREILPRIQDKDVERVVVLDAAQRDHPIGLNILAGAHDEISRELVAENIVHVFRTIWADFWGPRSDSLARAALTTLVNACGVDGSALTLCELVPLLTDSAFRRFIVNQPTIPATVRAYWQRYANMSDGERQQVLTPLVNKVEAFTNRTPIRLMLGQSDGLDLRDIFWHHKVVLVSLAKGSLGEEVANLLGALLLSLLWHATLGRVTIPPKERHPCFAYIDEAVDLMRLPVPFDSMAAQARGLGLGLVFGLQLLAQVPDYLKPTFLGTIRTQATFAVERDDAKLLEPRFAPLTADDLQGLARYELAVRPCLDGITRSPVTLTTLPLDAAIRDADELAASSRQRYGVARSDVEQALRARIAVTSDSSSVGRRRRGGSA